MNRRIRVFAPATVANLGPGFDVLGLALSQPGDELDAELSDEPGVEIVGITGDSGALSRDPQKNVVGRAAADVLRRAHARQGVRLWLHKQMPLASGLGSSGASSAAAAVAVNELLGKPLSQGEVVLSAMEGERAASGTPHADNVAPCVMGGIVLVRTYDPFETIALPVPENLHVAVVHPHCGVSTAAARRLVKDRTYGLDLVVPNLGSIAALVAALYRSDLPLLGRSIDDRIIEPLRATLIPGFAAVKAAALEAGAFGCSIAGSGPSVFGFAGDAGSAERIGVAMQNTFKAAAHLDSDTFTGRVSAEGARVV
ncbi:MAG TPA: homoserine kinase [Vicinamibacterales bacterium]|nr:homoserine kinase [Vicinamibacterales bacterium]